MSAPKKSSSRLVCRIIRVRSAARSSTDALPRWLQRHLEQCDVCQQRFAGEDAFDASLKQEAVDQRLTVPDLNESIMRAVRASRPEPEAPRRERAPVLAWGSFGAVAALALALVVQNNRAQVDEWSVQPEDMQAALATAQELSRHIWSSVEPSTAVLSSTQSLEEEMRLVYSDAGNALDVLEANFLPRRAEPIDSADQRS